MGRAPDRHGLAYIDDTPPEEMRATRGTLTEPGRNSPYRDRSAEENLDLFRRMRAGEFPNGARVLRARIDMASGNMNLRDPVLYRILHAEHPRTGDAWCIYPTYDFAHGQSDAIEGVTHSICTLEFEDHRPLYDWLIEHLPVPSRPRQYEFARLNLAYTVMSKRFLKRLVDERPCRRLGRPAHADPGGAAAARRAGRGDARIRPARSASRAPTASSISRCSSSAVRDVLNRTAPRRMAVLRPLKLVIENYPEGAGEELDAINHPDDPGAGIRQIRFGRELYIERDDFVEDPPKKFYRLAPGREVRLRYGYFVTCREVVKDAAGEIVELRCTYDPATRGGNAPDGRKVRGTIHWVSAADALPAEIRLYDPLFTRPDPGRRRRPDRRPQPAFARNPDGRQGRARRWPATIADGAVQFERQGYFCRDPDSTPGAARLQPHDRLARQLGQVPGRQTLTRIKTAGRGRRPRCCLRGRFRRRPRDCRHRAAPGRGNR